MKKPTIAPRLELCRKCPRFKAIGDKDETGQIDIYELTCRDGRRRWNGSASKRNMSAIIDYDVIAYEWRDPHRFDFNDQFEMPHDCNYKLENIYFKGLRRQNGNSYETQP